MTQKQTDRARGTHQLKTAEGGTCEDMEINQPQEGHSLPGDCRGRGLSGHGKKPTERGALTSWKRQREGLVRTRKESNRARGTYSLETGEGGTHQDKERNRSSEGNSLPGDDRGRDLSAVRTQKEIDRSRGTHTLETVEGGTYQDTERNRPCKGHSLPEDSRGRDLSGQGKILSEGDSLPVEHKMKSRSGHVKNV